MGLLSNESTEENFQQAANILEGVLQDWEDSPLGKSLGVEFSASSLRALCSIADQHIFSGAFFPKVPGPFKRAAAFAILIRHLLEINFYKLEGPKRTRIEDPELEIDWRARLAFAIISPTLGLIKLGHTDHNLKKVWAPATPHLQVELINWLRWLQAPKESQDNSYNIVRACRSILGLAMIIEQSYYITGNASRMQCDVMNAVDCVDSADPISTADLQFDLVEFTPEQHQSWW
jgi:hypothetical protein